MVEDLKKLQGNNQFIVARIADFRAVVHEVAEFRADLMKDIDEAKKLDAEAKRQDDALRDAPQDDALRELAEIESNMSAFKNFGDRLKASDELLASAIDWAQMRQKEGLKIDQAAAKGKSVKGAYQTLSKLEANVAAVLQKYRARIEEKVMKKINDQAKAILLTASTARKQMDGIEANLAKIDDLDIPKIDLAKAGRSLGITDRAQLAELDKALSGSVVDAEKALEVLGAKLTPRKKGKAMVAQLQKDKIL